MAALDRGLPDRVLVLKPNWIEEILAGRKLWELRGENLHLRGIVALAAKGELFGEVTIEHAMLVGIRDAEGTLLAPAGNEQNFLALPANMDKHRVKDLKVMSGPLRYASRVPYRHPPGAIKFVDLTKPGVLTAVPTPSAGCAPSLLEDRAAKRRRTMRRPAAGAAKERRRCRLTPLASGVSAQGASCDCDRSDSFIGNLKSHCGHLPVQSAACCLH